MIDLTKGEDRFAKMAAKRRHGLLCRYNGVVGWTGVALFSAGLFPVLDTSWMREALTTVGFLMIVLSPFGLAMSTTGKLYEHIRRTDG